MIQQHVERWRQRRRRKREIGEELQFHLQMCIEENLHAGMSEREAIEEARLRFGDIKEIHNLCCQVERENAEPRNEDPTLTYSPLSVPLSVWLLIGVLAPAGLLWFFAPHLVHPLPYQDPQRLWVSGQSLPLLAEESKEKPGLSFLEWRERNTVFSELAGFAPLKVRLQHPSGDLDGLQGLWVSSNFFRVFQTQPLLGSVFPETTGRDHAQPSIVISYEFWQGKLGGDPAIVGKSLIFDRQPVKVAAVMPPDFWFLSPATRFWFPIEASEEWPSQVRVVGRLRAGVAPREMIAELQQITRSRWEAGVGRQIIPLPQLTHRNLWAALAMVLVALSGAMALGFVQIMSLRRLIFPARLDGAVVTRYYLFLLCKSFLALLAPAALWVVLTESRATDSPKWLPVVVPTATMVFLLLCAAMVWWSLIDQRLRCPTCFRRLRMPVSLGKLGSILFDLPATEYICTHGHGTLHVPEPQSNEMEPTRWRPHGDVWEELFVTAKK